MCRVLGSGGGAYFKGNFKAKTNMEGKCLIVVFQLMDDTPLIIYPKTNASSWKQVASV